MIYHLTYRVGKGPKQHIYAIKDVCEKKKKKLLERHGKEVKFYKIELA